MQTVKTEKDVVLPTLPIDAPKKEVGAIELKEPTGAIEPPSTEISNPKELSELSKAISKYKKVSGNIVEMFPNNPNRLAIIDKSLADNYSVVLSLLETETKVGHNFIIDGFEDDLIKHLTNLTNEIPQVNG